ncbi:MULTISPECIES: DNA alkylation repair protein [unclassified Desulfovibrio]|uniref:DNA alkylation repair protein n=1 Tax=unclassified Desulfovibrio TaxID=2593640 RepID=UPI002FDAFDEA
MPEPLKNRFTYESLHDLALRISAAYSPFPVDDFVADIMDETWDSLELKARMRQITIHLGRHLPRDYEQALAILDKVIAGYPAGFADFTLLCFPDFVEVHGQDAAHWDVSMAALERYTAYSTAEFAVRPFIIKHEARMMAQMAAWAGHDNEHVRRLASEGCRPALPWGQALVSFKKDPLPVLAILERLKSDPSLYVRKSVANNLNDISKTHPELIAKITRDWYGKNAHTDWIVKHGCRTLLKKGDRNVLNIFGFADANSVHVDGFALRAASVPIGEAISFSFTIETKKVARVRLEYGIDYMKANGKRNRKIFQISEISLPKNGKKSYTKSHSFAEVSTRKHYPGTHSVTLLVNGEERGTLDFEVLAAK